MKALKMSLENIQCKLSRIEMKKIMAGSDHGTAPCDGSCSSSSDCGTNCQNCRDWGGGKVCKM